MSTHTLKHLHAFNNKTVLITGASGFIGENLASALSESSATVYGTSRIDRASTRKNFTWVTGSFDDIDSTRTILKKLKPDIIYHLAGEVTASNDIKHVQGTFHSLVTSTVNILTVATELKCDRIILTGSCTEPAEKTTSPNSPYSAAKWTTSAYSKMFWECYQTPTVIVRPFVGYGPGQSVGKLIPHVILSLLQNESPKLSSGTWESDWIYIDDIVEGMLAVAYTPGIEGESIDLGTGILTSVKEVVEKIADLIDSEGKPLFGVLPDRYNEHVRLADLESTFSKIKWRSETSLEEGLKQTIEAYQKTLLVNM